jgi:N-acetylglucosamine kinase-like BadF-type ATPase
MRYVLGIDGGGSKTVCLAADEQGRLLGYGQGGPVNTNYTLCPEAMRSLRRAIRVALEQAGLRGEEIEALCISAPMTLDAVQEVARELGIGRVIRAAEGETPRWAARFWVDGHVGVTVDAGTGAMARGWTREGEVAGAGGWGATLGDEGSGYWISLQAMAAVLQAYDGRIGETMLTKAVLAHFGMSDMLDMVFQVSQGLVRSADASQVRVAPDSGAACSESGGAAVGGLFFREQPARRSLRRHEVATLCPVVAEVARRGDWKAIEICRQAGHELGRLGAAIIRRLAMEEDEFVVVPFGGVFRAGVLVLGSFRETILATAPRTEVVMPRFEPVVGAVLLALSGIEVEIDARITGAIEQSSDDLSVASADGGDAA